MNPSQDFADNNTARDIAYNLYPNSQEITIVEHSYDNIVALIDTNYAIRFPRDKNSYARSLHEKHLLRQLENVKTLEVPRLLGECTYPPYLITSFVPGRHVSPSYIHSLSKNQQYNFAKTLAQFAYAMHSAFALDEELLLRKKLKLDELEDGEPWAIYFKETVKDYHFPTVFQDKIAKKYYKEWVDMCDVTPTVVVHDDLHTENMMFNDDDILTGVLDFGDTNVGTPEQELRQLYRISEDIMLTAVQEYQRLSGRYLKRRGYKDLVYHEGACRLLWQASSQRHGSPCFQTSESQPEYLDT
jgi:aminoglycoside phosphotransferase (APT) family kinase protein